MHEIRATLPPEHVENATRLARAAGIRVFWARLASFLINLGTISLAAVAAYAVLHLQPGGVWKSPRSGRAE
jgi:hypothetical protein